MCALIKILLGGTFVITLRAEMGSEMVGVGGESKDRPERVFLYFFCIFYQFMGQERGAWKGGETEQ